jgi:hypothetical protein
MSEPEPRHPPFGRKTYPVLMRSTPIEAPWMARSVDGAIRGGWGERTWGGQGSNLRPEDYESAGIRAVHLGR